MRARLLWSVCTLVAFSGGCHDPSQTSETVAPLQVAVAANFRDPAQKLARQFEREHPEARVALSAGSSGKLYAQIKNGAPFDVFLSADAKLPQKLEADGKAVRGSRIHYATGQLVLFGPGLSPEQNGTQALRRGKFKHVAIAHPETAPYGVAARQALEKLGLWQQLRPRIAVAENVAQAYQFVATGNAELGFVARSQVQCSDTKSCWMVPASLHDPIRQDAVALKPQAPHPLASEFMQFLKAPEAQALIRNAGYSSE